MVGFVFVYLCYDVGVDGGGDQVEMNFGQVEFCGIDCNNGVIDVYYFNVVIEGLVLDLFDQWFGQFIQVLQYFCKFMGFSYLGCVVGVELFVYLVQIVFGVKIGVFVGQDYDVNFVVVG